jgi:hypothetical protein
MGPEIRPHLRRWLAWYEEVVADLDGPDPPKLHPGIRKGLDEEARAVAHLLDFLDQAAEPPPPD